MGLDGDEEPRRGASRANSVRFDESAIHGYYGQVSRSSSELPMRTGSGMGSHPLTERSLSHRSDGRQSSSGHSHHSARTNSLGLESSSRMLGSSVGGSPLIPPPGLFLLGPAPGIIRCWLTTDFSNDSLLYAAVCSGSYFSSLGYPTIRRYGLDDLITQESGLQYLKLPVYLPEASISQPSSRASSPAPQVPAVTIRFLVRDVDPNDDSIQIILGSDVLRAHSADVMFSQDKMVMLDDDRNRVSIPLVRPENESVFKSLSTASDVSRLGSTAAKQAESPVHVNGRSTVGVIGRPTSLPSQGTSAAAATRASSMEDHPEDHKEQSAELQCDAPEQDVHGHATSDMSAKPTVAPDHTGPWSSWRRDSKGESAPSSVNGNSSRGRPMKVLRPSKSASRVNFTLGPTAGSSGDSTHTSSTPQHQADPPGSLRGSGDEPRTGKQLTSNPVGGASAFGWLNSAPATKRVVTNPK